MEDRSTTGNFHTKVSQLNFKAVFMLVFEGKISYQLRRKAIGGWGKT
jgi:hypothetical protein